MSRLKTVVRMINAFGSCQRPWKCNVIKRGDTVRLEGHQELLRVYTVGSHRRPNSRSPSNRVSRAYISSLQQWFDNAQIMRW